MNVPAPLISQVAYERWPGHSSAQRHAVRGVRSDAGGRLALPTRCSHRKR
jgi:hypothetical protein